MRLFFLDNYVKAKIKSYVQAPFYSALLTVTETGTSSSRS